MERTAFFVLLAAILMVIGYSYYTSSIHTEPKPSDFTLFKSASLHILSDTERNTTPAEQPDFYTLQRQGYFLEPFNPNVATFKQLIQVGIHPKLAQRIINFRQSGAVFRVKKDLLKVYGFDIELFQKIESLIDLPETLASINMSEASVPNKEIKKTAIIKLNTADTSQWKLLTGIGSVLAKRIVTFREKLGGFYSLNQLSEVYGLKSEVIESIKPQIDTSKLQIIPIYINTVSEKQLAEHPYFSKTKARVLVQYRNQHGNYQQIDDLLRTGVVDKPWLNKVKAYLNFAK